MLYAQGRVNKHSDLNGQPIFPFKIKITEEMTISSLWVTVYISTTVGGEGWGGE